MNANIGAINRFKAVPIASIIQGSCQDIFLCIPYLLKNTKPTRTKVINRATAKIEYHLIQKCNKDESRDKYLSSPINEVLFSHFRWETSCATYWVIIPFKPSSKKLELPQCYQKCNKSLVPLLLDI